MAPGKNEFIASTSSWVANAHVFGRPFGAKELRAAINRVRNLDRVWMTGRDQVANLVYPGNSYAKKFVRCERSKAKRKKPKNLI